MIFVTVGTHEQQFDRLVKYIDENFTNAFIQSGYSKYTPRYNLYSQFISYNDMIKHMKEADVVICHGAPATIMQCLQFGKKPIVVPRQRKFKEHINDHQLYFSRKLYQDNKIYLIENINDLTSTMNSLLQNDKLVEQHIEIPNPKFIESLELEINMIFSNNK